MTTPVLNRVDLDAEPVFTAYGADGSREGERRSRHYDGTDRPPHGEFTAPAGNGDLDEKALEQSERKMASALGW